MTATMTNGDGRKVTQRDLAREHNVSERTIRRWQKAAKSNGHGPATQPKRVRNRTSPPPPKPDLLDKWGRPVVGWTVTLLALVFSYSRMRHLAALAGVSWPDLAPLLPDLLMAAAVLCLRRHPRYRPAVAALVIACVATLALNGLAERPELVAMADVRLWWALMVPATAVFGVHLVVKR